MHILGNVRPASILSDFCLYCLNGKIAGHYRIFYLDRYFRGIIMPSRRCIDCDFYTWIDISTFLVILCTHLTIFIYCILTAFFLAGAFCGRLCLLTCAFCGIFRCILCGLLCVIFSTTGTVLVIITGRCAFCTAFLCRTFCFLLCCILRMNLHSICPVCKKCPDRHTKKYCRQYQGH